MLEKDSLESPSYTLVLDAGGFSAGLGALNKVKTEFLLRGYNRMNYSAINLGYRDFLHGTGFLKEMEQKYDLPFISTNIYVADTNEPFVQRYLIKQMEDVKNNKKLRIGILGIEVKNANLIPEYRRQGGLLLNAADPIAESQDILHEMNGKVDIVICLAHMRLQQAKNLASKVQGIDVIILGNDFRKLAVAVNEGRTLIVTSDRHGKYIGDLTLFLDDKNQIIDHRHSTNQLDDSYADVPEYAKLYEDFKKEALKSIR